MSPPAAPRWPGAAPEGPDSTDSPGRYDPVLTDDRGPGDPDGCAGRDGAATTYTDSLSSKSAAAPAAPLAIVPGSPPVAFALPEPPTVRTRQEVRESLFREWRELNRASGATFRRKCEVLARFRFDDLWQDDGIPDFDAWAARFFGLEPALVSRMLGIGRGPIGGERRPGPGRPRGRPGGAPEDRSTPVEVEIIFKHLNRGGAMAPVPVGEAEVPADALAALYTALLVAMRDALRAHDPATLARLRVDPSRRRVAADAGTEVCRLITRVLNGWLHQAKKEDQR